MRSSTFSKPLHRVVAAIVALALGLSLVGVGMAPSALAAAQATIGDNGQGSSLNTSEGTIWGGLFEVTIDGNASVAYCIDLQTGLNKSYAYWEVDFATAIPNAANRTRILKILHHYGPSGTSYPGSGTNVGPAGKQITGTGDEKAASVQAAIWHYSDGMTLYAGGQTSAAEKANYDMILASVDGLADPGNPGVSLDITEPASTTAEAGQVVGPYTISTTAASVTLTPAPGVTITDAAGNPLPGPYGNGTQLWLKKTTAGDHAVAVTAETTATVVAGRAFVAKDKDGKELRSQKLILAHSVQSKVKDTAKAKWTEPIKHSAKVWKDINGGPIPQNGFQFSLTGGDLQQPITGSVSVDDGFAWMGQSVLKPGTYTMTESPVAGWQQRALGCDAPATNVSTNGSTVTFTIPVAQQPTKVACHFENNKLYDIAIKKVVTTDDGTWDDAGYDPATETFTVAYSCTKPNQPAITGQVVLEHDETKTVSNIPYGYSCAVTGEPALPTLVDGVAWNAYSANGPVAVTGPGKKLTVSNSFADRRVDFKVTKQLVNLAGSGVDTDDEFPVSVDCTKDGSPTFEYDFTLAHDETWTSPKLPTGYSCAIAEGTLPTLSEGFGWDTPAISPNPVVTGQHNSATITNTVLDQRVQLTVKKVLVNKADSGVDGSTTFDIDVTCTKGDATIEYEDIELAHDGVWTSPKLPAGYSCTAVEEALAPLNDGFEWAPVDVTPASLTTGGNTTQIVVTNTVNDPRVKLKVSKEFANANGSGVPDDHDFDITVTCTKDGFPTKVYDLLLGDEDSWTSPALPAGYSCAVTEDLPVELLSDGFSFDDPVFEPESGTVTTGRVDLEITIDNEVDDDRVFISLAKELEGDLEDADVEAGTEYVVDVLCTDDDSDDTLTFPDVTVTAGEDTTGIGPIPIGWSCTADEDESSLPTLAPGHIWLPESVVGTTVGEQGGTVTVTNAVEDRRSAITIRKDVVEGSATSGTFTFDLLKVDGEATEVIAEDVEAEVGEAPVVLADELTAGTYRVVEGAASGWDLVGVECSVEGGGDTVTLGDTDDATVACAATNVELGSITVVKETAPADADVDFPVTLTGEGYEEDATVNATADPVVFDGLLPGTYTLTEGEVEGWDNGPITCIGGGEQVSQVETSALLVDGITLTPGDHVICTITNVERGSITVTKQVEGATVTTDETVTPWVEDVVISLECDDEQELTLTLEPGAEPGTLVSTDVLDVAAGTTCVVTEVSDGVTAAGAVDITIDGVAIVEGTPSSPITVDAGEELVVEVVNTYEGTEVEGEVITKKPTQVAGNQLPRTGSDLTRQLALLAGVLITVGGLVLALGALAPRRREI